MRAHPAAPRRNNDTIRGTRQAYRALVRAKHAKSIPAFAKNMAKNLQPLPPRLARLRAMRHSQLLWLAALALILLGAAAWITFLALKPIRTRVVVITAGGNGGIYMTFAGRYAQAVAKDGIRLDVRISSGAVENYQRLRDSTSEYDVGLVQSGTGNAKDAPGLQTLASVSFEPIWIFYRGQATIDRLSQLDGKRIGVGQAGSGLRTVMLSLLAMHGVTPGTATLEEIGAAPAAKALAEGRLDAAAFIGAPDIAVIDGLLKSNLRLLSMQQADTIVRRFPSLSKVIFPRGAIDLARDLPPQDVTLVSTTALLVAKKTLHHEIAYDLLDAASAVHGIPSFFSSRGDFPNQRVEDFPITEETRRFFKTGRPFLQNYLPFWLANFIEQRFVILLPAIAIFFALVQMLPRIHAYRMRSRLARWYHEIKLLEDEVLATATPDAQQRLQWYNSLQDIETCVMALAIPTAFIRDIYVLRHAIRMVADRLGPCAPTALAPEDCSRII